MSRSLRVEDLNQRVGQILSASFLASLVFLLPSTAAAEESSGVLLQKSRRLLQEYCSDCHGSDLQEAEIDVSGIHSSQDLLRNPRQWERVLAALQSHQMPPEDSPQLTRQERRTLADWIDRSFEEADWQQLRHPGRAVVARLTRNEYEFTVRDLFGMKVDLSEVLPRDPEGLSGFSNDRLSMNMTASQLERTFQAAELVADTLLDASDQSDLIRYEAESGENASFTQKVSEDQGGVRGWKFSPGLGRKYQFVRKTIDFPSTGYYRVRVRARSTGPGPAAGFWIAADGVNDATREAGVLVGGKTFGVYETDMFLSEGQHEILFGYDFYRPQWLPAVPERAPMKLGQSTFDPPPYNQEPLLPDGVTLDELKRLGYAINDQQFSQVTKLVERINAGYYPAVLDHLMLNKFHYSKGYLPVFIGGLGYEYTTKVAPALRELAELLDTDRKTLENVWERHETPIFDELRDILAKQRAAWKAQSSSRNASVGGLMVDWIEFEQTSPVSLPHPLPTKAPEVEPFLGDLLPKALRRPVPSEQLETYLSIYRKETSAGTSHQEALRRMLVAILVSPQFLYRNEGDAAVGIEPLDDYALASRLSYFLWSSLPDEPLWETARGERLQHDDELDRQVARMLQHGNSARFARAFTEQWLNLEDIGLEKEPDKELFRYFSTHLADDMRSEVAMQLERILVEDLSLLELLDSNHTFLNERLARLYGIEGVRGDEMRLVSLANTTRGGLLGTAGVLTATSLATRTSPVRRGQFVLETLLGAELPPPPPGVPALGDDAGQSEEQSLRQTLAMHRADSKCAGCHNKIDPLGFALENFDWIGRSRTEDPAGPIDSHARLPNGTAIDGYVALRRYLVKNRRDDFVRALSASMLSYGLGRELQFHDEHALRRIVEAVRNDNYSAWTLVRQIVKSYPFRFRADTNPSDSEL